MLALNSETDDDDEEEEEDMVLYVAIKVILSCFLTPNVVRPYIPVNEEGQTQLIDSFTEI